MDRHRLWVPATFHHSYSRDPRQQIYRKELDPSYDAALHAGVPFCAPAPPSYDLTGPETC